MIGWAGWGVTSLSACGKCRRLADGPPLGRSRIDRIAVYSRILQEDRVIRLSADLWVHAHSSQMYRWSREQKQETRKTPKPAQGFISRANAGEPIYETHLMGRRTRGAPTVAQQRKQRNMPRFDYSPNYTLPESLLWWLDPGGGQNMQGDRSQ